MRPQSTVASIKSSNEIAAPVRLPDAASGPEDYVSSDCLDAAPASRRRLPTSARPRARRGQTWPNRMTRLTR
jgi:hypothetical protein